MIVKSTQVVGEFAVLDQQYQVLKVTYSEGGEDPRLEDLRTALQAYFDNLRFLLGNGDDLQAILAELPSDTELSKTLGGLSLWFPDAINGDTWNYLRREHMWEKVGAGSDTSLKCWPFLTVVVRVKTS